MRKLTMEQAIIALELREMLAEFIADIDDNFGRNIADFYTADGAFGVGDFEHVGHAAIRKFYSDREERIKPLHKDGIRVSTHTFLNHRVEIADNDNATIFFTNVNYAGEGHPPVLGTIEPAMITDCHMKCRREADGMWRITYFAGKPKFVGNDPFVKKQLLKD